MAGMAIAIPGVLNISKTGDTMGKSGDIGAESLRPSRFCQFLSPGCINFKNLSAHQQEEVLRIPKHPQLVKFRLF